MFRQGAKVLSRSKPPSFSILILNRVRGARVSFGDERGVNPPLIIRRFCRVPLSALHKSFSIFLKGKGFKPSLVAGFLLSDPDP